MEGRFVNYGMSSFLYIWSAAWDTCLNVVGAREVRDLHHGIDRYVETPMLKTSGVPPDSYLDRDLERTPLKRLGMIEEVTDAIVFLASPMSSYMQGAALVVDGGYSSQ